MRSNLSISLTAVFLCLVAAPLYASDAEKPKETAQSQQAIYGSQLMTPEERIEHRNKMLSFKTPDERDAYRLEHHKQMQERAKEKGMTLPEAPPSMGLGKGYGMGPGSSNRSAQ